MICVIRYFRFCVYISSVYITDEGKLSGYLSFATNAKLVNQFSLFINVLHAKMGFHPHLW